MPPTGGAVSSMTAAVMPSLARGLGAVALTAALTSPVSPLPSPWRPAERLLAGRHHEVVHGPCAPPGVPLIDISAHYIFIVVAYAMLGAGG